jgi:hypothetical protein
MSRVVELRDPSAPLVSVHAIVPLPEMGPHDEAVVRVVAEAIKDSTESYGKEQWRDVAARAGSVLRCTTMPDHIEISMGVPPGETKTALTFLHAIVRRATLPDDAIARALEMLPLRHHGFWMGAMLPLRLDYGRIRRVEVVEMYQRLFRPEKVTVAVGGPIQPGEADAVWSNLISDWVPPRLRYQAPDRSSAKFADKLSDRASVIVLRGPSFVSKDVALPTRLLALMAIGTGKGSSLFRVVREANGWSYLQDAVLWPTPNGFEPRLVIARRSPEGLESLSAQVREALLADVKAWTAADLDRAKGIAAAIFTRGLPVNPLYLRDGRSALTGSIEDRTFLAAYWMMKTGAAWNEQSMLTAMGTVSLDDLRQTATDMLAESSTSVFRGR